MSALGIWALGLRVYRGSEKPPNQRSGPKPDTRSPRPIAFAHAHPEPWDAEAGKQDRQRDFRCHLQETLRGF